MTRQAKPILSSLTLSLLFSLVLVAVAPGSASAWAPARIGGRAADRGDGSLFFVGREASGAFNFGAKTSLNGSGASAWPLWRNLGGSFSSNPVAVVNANNKITIVGRWSDNRIFQMLETSAGSGTFPFATAIAQGSAPSFVADPALVRLGDGKLAVFATSNSGAIYQSTQLAAGGAWSAYTSLGAPSGKRLIWSPVVAINGNGALSVFARGSDDALWLNQQTAAGGTWRGWVSLGWTLQYTVPTDGISINYDSQNRLMAIVNDAGGTISFTRQTTSSGTTWTAWARAIPAGAHGLSRPSAARNGDGRITTLFYANYGTSLQQQSQTAPGSSSWEDWSVLVNPVSSPPVSITDLNNIIHVFALDNSSQLHEIQQTSQNSTSYTNWWSGFIGITMSGL